MLRTLRLAYFVGFFALMLHSYARLDRMDASASGPVLVASGPAAAGGGLFDRMSAVEPLGALRASAGPAELFDVHYGKSAVRVVAPGGRAGASRASLTDSSGLRYELVGPPPSGLAPTAPAAPIAEEIGRQKRLAAFGLFGSVAAFWTAFLLTRRYLGPVRLKAPQQAP
ncbi:MAG TPA: hypothetical protein VNI01_05785 [Elusimicrobiota bacterium]|nr:hypothetical protein [Elusimicrobiota bacterium]